MVRGKVSIGAILCASLYAAPLYAQTSGAAFLTIDPSPRSYALGSVDAIASSGAQAIGQNPANLGLSAEKYETFTSYQTLLGGAQYGHIAFAVNQLGAIDAVGLAVTHLGVSAIAGADANGNLTGSSFSTNDTAVTLGASSRITSNLSVGADIKGVQSSVGSYSSNWAAAGDLGATLTFTHDGRPLSLALSVDNLGQGLKFVSQTDPLPAVVKAAAAVPLGKSAMALVQLENQIYDHVTQAGVGVEYAVGPVSLRGGYTYAFNAPSNLALGDQPSTGEKALGGLTAGVGLRLGPVRFDYAMSQQAVDYGATQRVSLTVAWGGHGAAKSEPKAEVDYNKSDWTRASMGDWITQ
jgi:hypothetical protein